MGICSRLSVRPEERLSEAKSCLEGQEYLQWFETGLRFAQSLLTTNGIWLSQSLATKCREFETERAAINRFCHKFLAFEPRLG